MAIAETIQVHGLAMDVLRESSSLTSLEEDLLGMLQGLEDNVSELLGDGSWDLEFSLHLVEDKKMQGLNSEHRGKDCTTDVLSFPVHENLRGQMPEGVPLVQLGDVVISLPRAEEQSREHGISLHEEVAHLLVHGFLHLLGFDHKMENEAEAMLALEDQLIQSIYHRCRWVE